MKELMKCLDIDNPISIRNFKFYKRNNASLDTKFVTNRANGDSLALSIFSAMPSINQLILVEVDYGRVFLLLNQMVSEDEMEAGENAIKETVPVTICVKGLIIDNSEMDRLIEYQGQIQD